jgi:hypothetical protein
MFNWMGLGCIDTLGGAIVGFVQGALLVTVCILVTVAFFPQTQWLTQATLPADVFRSLSCEHGCEPGRAVGTRAGRPEVTETRVAAWMHEKNGGIVRKSAARGIRRLHYLSNTSKREA